MAKNSQNIDNLFRDALNNYNQEQPSRSVWQGISKKLFLHDLLYLKLLNIPYFVPSVIAVIATITLFLFLISKPETDKNNAVNKNLKKTEMSDPEFPVVSPPENEIRQKENAIENEIPSYKLTAEPGKNITIGTSEKTEHETIAPISKTAKKKVKEEKLTDLPIQSAVNSELQINVSESKSVEESSERTLSKEASKAFDPVVLSEKTYLNTTIDELLRPVNYIIAEKIIVNPTPFRSISMIRYSDVTGSASNKKRFDYYLHDQYTVGLHFTPEKMYNSPDDRPDKNIFSVDFSFIYQMNKYIFQTGLGFTYYENNHNYKVNYREFLGTYNDLDSIAFVYNPGAGSVTPNYFWTETSVFDTANQTLTSGVTNFYSTLQIPLLIGYKIFELKRFSLFVKGGVLASFLVNKNEPGATYYSPDKKVTSIDYATPSRTAVNWMFQGSLSAGYQITQRLNLAVEPTVKYYFNNIYGRNINAGTQPYLLGIRTGLTYTIK